jgi:tRNA 5-methylaminomethyl-2-thiouridine biosynthesis bifunctional protein
MHLTRLFAGKPAPTQPLNQVDGLLVHLEPATLAFCPDGTPYSETYAESYHTSTGGLGQARHVFLGGNGLPGRWQRRERFVVVETGFGLGLNFLATWDAWKSDAQRCARLHFVSLEKHPFTAADLATLYGTWLPASDAAPLAPFATQLLAQWPTLTPGFQRLHFEGGAVTLTLVFGDATSALAQVQAQADAFYLDGFSPAKNPELWTPAVCATLSRLAAPGATLATWSVASAPRDNLAARGWSLEKVQGYRGKRDMLCGRWPGEMAQSTATDRRAIVIGAGIAGSSAAERLAARGWQIDLIDRGQAAGQGASGNLAGVFRPLPSVDDNRLTRLTRACFLYARRHFSALEAEGWPVRWGKTGVLHLARDDAQETIQRKIVDTQQPPADYLAFVDRDDACELANWPLDSGGWWFPGGAWVEPPSACRANLARHAARIRSHFGVEIERIERCEEDTQIRTQDRTQNRWQAWDTAGQLIAEAPVLILANATDALRFAPSAHLPLRAARGQVSHLPARAAAAPRVVVCRGAYVTPAVDGVHCAGASFLLDASTLEPALRTAEHLENLAKLDFVLPGFAAAAPAVDDPAALGGRVGFRPVALDRTPVIGQIADEAAINPALPSRPLKEIARIPGLYIINGFGSRGIVWSALAGELLVSLIEGEPLPVETDLAASVDPARFMLRGKNKSRADR